MCGLHLHPSSLFWFFIMILSPILVSYSSTADCPPAVKYRLQSQWVLWISELKVKLDLYFSGNRLWSVTSRRVRVHFCSDLCTPGSSEADRHHVQDGRTWNLLDVLSFYFFFLGFKVKCLFWNKMFSSGEIQKMFWWTSALRMFLCSWPSVRAPGGSLRSCRAVWAGLGGGDRRLEPLPLLRGDWQRLYERHQAQHQNHGELPEASSRSQMETCL